jgi:hypothetical protein
MEWNNIRAEINEIDSKNNKYKESMKWREFFGEDKWK